MQAVHRWPYAHLFTLLRLQAYGQTGSGKTWTMLGTIPEAGQEEEYPPEAGLIPRIFEHLFSRICELEAQKVLQLGRRAGACSCSS